MTLEELGINYSRSLYILGTSFGGPVNVPILVENITQGLSIFGVSKLMTAWYEAKQVMGDAVNVYLVRINGEESYLDVQGINRDASKQYDPITVSSYSAGEVWNNASVIVTEDYIKISNPSDIGGSASIYFKDHVTVGQVVGAINFAFEQGAIGITASTTTPTRPSTDITKAYADRYGEVIYLSGGSDEVFFTKNELHRKLEMTYNIIEGQTIDVITVVNAFFDDVPPFGTGADDVIGDLFYSADRDYLELPSAEDDTRYATFHGQMIDFCKRQMSMSIVTHGVMAFNPVENVEDILQSNAYATKVAGATCLSDKYDIVKRTSETKVEDNGKYLSVTLGEFEYVDLNNNLYYNNAYVAYAALMASSLTSSSLTNTLIPNISNLRYYLEDDEAKTLSRLGVVTFRKSALKQGIVVTNGVTTSINTSPYHVVSNMRMIQMILNTYNVILEKYIGENVDLLIKSQAMQKNADEIARALVDAKIARDIKAQCNISPIGVAVLKLDIMPIYSTEYVGVTSTIKL